MMNLDNIADVIFVVAISAILILAALAIAQGGWMLVVGALMFLFVGVICARVELSSTERKWEMAEYLPLFDPGKAITRTASAAITGGQLLIVSGSGTVAPTAAVTPATHSWVGVAGQDAANGEYVTVYSEGIQRLTATGAVTAGQHVEAGVNGTVAAHTNGANDVNVVGVALTSAGGGALVDVSLLR